MKEVSSYLRIGKKILEIEDYLNEKKLDYYDGGYSFEDIYCVEYAELKRLHEQFIELHKELITL